MIVQERFSGRFKVLHIFLLIYLVSVLFISLFYNNTIYAQGTKYPYDMFPDRKEGIINGEKLISGDADIELVSAFIANQKFSVVGKTLKYHLSFYIPDNVRAKIVVQEYKKSYRMELLQKDFTKGMVDFSWPSEIPTYYKIDANDLFPLAKVLPLSSQKIIPIAVYTQTSRESEVSYRFGFVPLSDVSVLEYTIYDAQTLNMVYSAELKNVKAEPNVEFIRWNGRDQNNNTIRDGQYSLIVEATFKSEPGTLAYEVVEKYHFYHYNDLFKKLLQ